MGLPLAIKISQRIKGDLSPGPWLRRDLVVVLCHLPPSAVSTLLTVASALAFDNLRFSQEFTLSQRGVGALQHVWSKRRAEFAQWKRWANIEAEPSKPANGVCLASINGIFENGIELQHRR